MRALLLPLLALAALPAAAQEGLLPLETFYETATVEARPLSSATGSVTVIGGEEIEASGARTVGELLRLSPGVSLTTNATRGGLAVAHIRAGESNFTLVLLDGVALNDPLYQEGDVFDLEGLPTAGIERIEIVRGPLSSFYGSTGLAGVIQIFTRDGRPGRTSSTAEIAGGDASFRRGSGTVSGGAGSAGSYSVTALWEEESERIAGERFEQAGGLASLTVPVGAARLRLKARGTSWEGDDYPDASGGPVYGSGELRSSEHGEASLAAELTRGTQRITASVYRHAMDRRSPGVGFLVPPSSEETAFTRLRAGWSSVLAASGGRRWSAGVDVQHEDGENDSVLFLGDREIPGDYDVSRTLPGAWTELVVDRGPWTFEAGSRVDVPEDHATQWSPRLGVGWRPTEWIRLHASAGRAWKLPSFFALASPPQLGGNPDLRPETVLGGDVGADWRLFCGRVETGLTLFYNRYEDLIDFDFPTFTHVNRSEVETRGVEGTLGWRPASGRLSFQANATRQEFEDRTGGANLRHRPDWTGGAAARWQPVAAVTLDLDARAVSGSYDEQIPVRGRDRVEGYELVGLGASWRLAGPLKGWELRLRGENLLDEEYETLIGFPGPERSWWLGLRWRSDPL